MAQTRVRQQVRRCVAAILLALSSALVAASSDERQDLQGTQGDEAARRVAALGLLVDSTNGQRAQDGLHVLGTTPGSAADHLGLRPGDVIVAVNGESLRSLGSDDRGHALASATLKTVVASLPDDVPLELHVARAGTEVTLSAPLQAVYLPDLHGEPGMGASGTTVDGTAQGAASDGCGRISMFDVAPRGDRLYAVKILLLDGSTPGPHGTQSFRVRAGEHHLLVSENIPTGAMGIGTMASLRRNTNKALTVTVKPGTTLLIAAQLHLANTGDLVHGGYWDPVVWKEIAEACP